MSRPDDGADWFADDDTTSAADGTWMADLRRRAADDGRSLIEVLDDAEPEDQPDDEPDDQPDDEPDDEMADRTQDRTRASLPVEHGADDEQTVAAADVLGEIRAAVDAARAEPGTPPPPVPAAPSSAEPAPEPTRRTPPATQPARPPATQPDMPPATPPEVPGSAPEPADVQRQVVPGPQEVPPGPRWEAPPRLAAADEFVEPAVRAHQADRWSRRTIVAIGAAVILVFVLGMLVANALFDGDDTPPEEPVATIPGDGAPAPSTPTEGG